MSRQKVTQATTPQPMSAAPKDGGWVLGLVLPGGPTETDWQPWIPVTWGDGGWVDDDYNQQSPTSWIPIPDPQPRPTGWRPAEGTIHVAEMTGQGWTDGKGNPVTVPWRWHVYIDRLDGSYDEYRDSHFFETREQAVAKASKWGDRFGLPLHVTTLPSNVVPIRGGRND